MQTAERIEACFVDLGETLLALAGGRTLTGEQREAVTRTVTALLRQQGQLLDEFSTIFDPDRLAVYGSTLETEPLAGDDDESAHGTVEDDDEEHVLLSSPVHRASLLDEALYFFGLLRLTTVTGAETRGHLQRSAALVRPLCEVLDCTPRFIDTISFAVELHDVGLVAVPEALLQRRGKIESQELMLIDTHTKVGAYLINSVAGKLDCDSGPLPMAADIALYHHERYDGLGPHGMQGSDIPYPARIFQLVDVYDTLRRDRPYRAAIDHPVAVEMLRRANDGGTMQFDPAVLAAFLHAQPHFEKIYAAMPEES